MKAAGGKPVQAVCAGRALCKHGDEVGATAVALVGDFNSQPGDAALIALSTGLPEDHIKHPGCGCKALELPQGLRLRSAYAAVHGKEPPFTRKKQGSSSQFTLDYILLGQRSGSLEVQV